MKFVIVKKRCETKHGQLGIKKQIEYSINWIAVADFYFSGSPVLSIK